jgi:hypothetical protein
MPFIVGQARFGLVKRLMRRGARAMVGRCGVVAVADLDAGGSGTSPFKPA